MYNIARVAVSKAIFAIDKPYDYRIPEILSDKIQVGKRVMVPFGRGNKRCEAMVLSLAVDEGKKQLKEALEVLDDEPVLNEDDLKLSLWVRERCFCALYDVFRAQLPTALWYKFTQVFHLKDGVTHDDIVAALSKSDRAEEVAGVFIHAKDGVKNDYPEEMEILLKSGLVYTTDVASRKVGDKTAKNVKLAVDEDALDDYLSGLGRRAPMQKAILELLRNIGGAAMQELCYFTGATSATINTLASRGIVELSEVEVYRRPKLNDRKPREDIKLNAEQAAAYTELSLKLDTQKPSCSLLYGVTGSGKTLVYIKLIEKAIEMGKGAIMLVPEIALTPQMVERFYSYFGDKIAILHSALSIGERFDEWKRIKKGEVSVVVGTRSAVFAPIPNLGLIIMDEEQEHTYKSGNTPRYHARDIAKFRCVSNGAMLLLGSATPSIESMYAAKSGKYCLYTLSHRFNEQKLPRVIISDMRQEIRGGNGGTLGKTLIYELEENIKNGEQSILFLNRRGQARYAICGDCGYSPECPNCSVTLTYHSANKRFMCHHCAYSIPANDVCPNCGSKMQFHGAGTQRLEDELKMLFPGVEVLRMDYDTTRALSSHEQILNKFERERVPILIGTQMITKGLDFENVTLVGVLSADQALNIDDFRAQENTFSLITQVVGRAGRGAKGGRAVIQTVSPKNAILHHAAKQDYDAFYNTEINLRKMRSFPPFCDIITLVVSGVNESDVFYGSAGVADKLNRALSGEYNDLNAKIYGPTPASLLKVSGKYRYKISVCCENTKRFRELISRVLCDFRSSSRNRRLTIIADVNSIEF
ncbi:MAG: primosomal protein N' [Clostridia bacterium]|nr:primosomal protein N' [Clostridia bacterium]